MPGDLLAERKRRWQALHDPASAQRRVFLVSCAEEQQENAAANPAPPYPEEKEARIETALRSYEQQCRHAEWLDDDSLPFVDVYTGTEIFAAAFGCDVYRHEGSNPSARTPRAGTKLSGLPDACARATRECP